MTQQNILDLKKYIEWFDEEVFPRRPIPVRLAHRRFSRNGLVAYHRDLSTWNILLRLCFVVFVYSITAGIVVLFSPFILLSLFSRKQKTGMKRVFIKAFLRAKSQVLKLVSFRDCYTVSTKNTPKNISRIQLLSMAAHEVRHRVQREKAYLESIKENSETGRKISIVFENKRKEFEILISKNFYKKSEAAIEIDSMTVEAMMYALFLEKFPEEKNFSDEEIKNFARECKILITTKYPESP